ncbi:hypothetical protein [Burkholderia thailandensis]|uniref:hypothetical protein n=1 Tax=Burkholderia thailandensis TaxID=57975 RepID=UPI0004B8BAAF|nr:hypothetical protein [Burkholderia thailandensis]MCS3392859.1 hypothetical protein [Burkholderia thailandensis]MCS6425669.1 hypothetical protein [Burkholderia thailandensis]MCS6453319.1 hypothetical protein [Burkholderia thailandensis]MCS6464927.1 hypothetical protein [Burkholderia thailandensis]MCS6482541.1 hypothetical protein [Burkholderia thailandensis]
MRLIGEHAHVRVRQQPSHASRRIGGIEQPVAFADNHEPRRFDRAQLLVAEHRDSAQARAKIAVDRVEQRERRRAVGARRDDERVARARRQRELAARHRPVAIERGAIRGGDAWR